ncbi:MAG: IS4 family transposase [Nitrospira sp.]|nr:IS4 family transposase [Nitrospira sp.]
MVRNVSLFGQLLQHVSRTEFARAVKKYGAERAAKGFTCWTQCVAMIFCHLARADSLREVCNGLACCLGKLNHLGIDRAPNKSTLAYANQHRPAGLYESLFWSLLARFRSHQSLGLPKAKAFRFKNRLLSLDSTTISLCLQLFPWASYLQTKGGVKVHVLLDHSDYMPSYAVITEGKQADVRIAQSLQMKPGSVVAMDRAYNDFTLFGRWTRSGVFFVTRLKEGTVYELVEHREVPKNRPILADEIIRLSSSKGQKACPELLRLVVVWDPEREREIVLLTNHLGFGATTIAAIYRERWQIELFFKALKQNLKVKTFIGTSENALRIQIWTALIALLLLRWLHHLSQARWSFSNLASMLRLNLFTYRDLKEWLDNPFQTPPETPLPEQFVLGFAGLGQPLR